MFVISVLAFLRWSDDSHARNILASTPYIATLNEHGPVYWEDIHTVCTFLRSFFSRRRNIFATCVVFGVVFAIAQLLGYQCVQRLHQSAQYVVDVL